MKNKIFLLFAIIGLIATTGSVSAMGFNELYKANVRVIHASPDAPAVDVWVNGEVGFSDLEFEKASEYAKLSRGAYDIQVVPAGLTEPVVIDANLDFVNRRYYTVLAIDTLNSIEPLVLEDKLWGVGNGKAKVRFVHASPDAPAVDIAVTNGPVIFEEVDFKEVGDYLKVSSGEYDLEVRLAGTDTVVLPLPGIMLESNKAYTAIATGQVSDGTLNAVLVEDKDWNVKK